MPSGDEANTIASPPEGDGRAFVVFTQLRTATPFLYAGWLNAPDREGALYYAREHYGRDQKCVAIWAIPREALHASDAVYTCEVRWPEPVSHEIFTQAEPGDTWKHAGTVTAESGRDAVTAAQKTFDAARDAHVVWSTASDQILRTREDDVVFRLTDQSYRLAGGYGRLVHRKWEQFRADENLAAYEQEDLKEAF